MIHYSVDSVMLGDNPEHCAMVGLSQLDEQPESLADEARAVTNDFVIVVPRTGAEQFLGKTVVIHLEVV